MVPDLKPYPEMVDSAVEWLGALPKHWSVVPNRALFEEVRERDHPEATMLSVTIARGVIRQETLLTNSAKKDISNQDKSAYKFVRPGDIAYNKMRAWQGAVGVSDHFGIISPAYVVQRPRRGLLGRYFHYLFRNPAFTKEAERWSYGITSDMWSLRPEHFKMIYGCIPPLREQSKIVRFLDYIEIYVRRYIRAKQKLVELLEQQKSAVVRQTVTLGLDSRVRLKPSGVDWLGDIPEHWTVARLRRSVSGCVNGIWGSDPNGRDDLVCVRVADFDRVCRRVDLTMPTVRAIGSSERSHRLLGNGDLLLEKSGGGDLQPVGSVILFDHDTEAVCSNFIARMRVSRNYDSNFLLYLHSHLYAIRLNVRSIKQTTGIQNLDSSSYLREIVAFPPLAEQVAIAAFLKRANADIDGAVKAIQEQISLLREYRTRLITDVVTGKLDVREAAASLPVESGDSGGPDDLAGAGEQGGAKIDAEFEEATI